MLIRQGSHGQAGEMLKQVLQEEIPRSSVAEAAALARRLSQPLEAIKVLRPFVRPSDKKMIIATTAEKAEYAGALVRLGMISEAKKLLREIPADEYPRSYLFQAFALISHWDYQAAEGPLNKYIQHPKADPYEVLLAKVNLGFGYVYQNKKSEKFIQDLLLETKNSENYFLYSNTLEMAADFYTQKKKWKKAQEFIQLSETLLKDSGTIDAYLVRKQKAILELKQKGFDSQTQKELLKVRQEALDRGHWESFRDCQYHLALAQKNLKEITKIYFGTPYNSYQKRIANHVHITDDFYVYGPEGKAGRDLYHIGQNWPDLPHRLLIFLVKDFYRPRRTYEIFDELYPNEFFDPKSSPFKVHQILKRLRQYLRDDKIPIDIVEQEGFFKIRTKIGLKISRLNEPLKDLKSKQDLETELKRFKKAGLFTVNQYASGLKIPRRSAQRSLQKLVAAGLLTKQGKAWQTKYHRPIVT